MPSRLGRNLRRGHLAEDIGITVLRGFSAVADVRHQDDIGVDAYCVLLRPEESLLLADAPFSVQFKSASNATIQYDEHAVDWFISLQIPLFYGHVDAASGKVAFYTASRFRQLLFDPPDFSRIVLNFSSTECKDENETLEAGMFPPILECNEREARTDEFAHYAYSHFKRWIKFEARAIELQKFNIHVSAKWDRGGNPEVFFEGSDTKLRERQSHMQEALPIIDKLAYHAMGTDDCDPGLLKAFLRIFEWYRKEGYDKVDLSIDDLTQIMTVWESYQE